MSERPFDPSARLWMTPPHDLTLRYARMFRDLLGHRMDDLEAVHEATLAAMREIDHLTYVVRLEIETNFSTEMQHLHEWYSLMSLRAELLTLLSWRASCLE